MVSSAARDQNGPLGGEPADGAAPPRDASAQAARHTSGIGVTEHAPSVPSEVQQAQQRGCPCWHRPPGPLILAVAQPLPLI